MHPTGHDLDSWLLAFTEAADVVEPGSPLVYVEIMTCQGNRRRAIRLLERFS